jgi:hypothetical protein
MNRDKQPGRRITIRSVRRDPPDVRKLSRALIALAYAQAKAEADAEAEYKTAGQKPRKRGADGD